MEVVIIEKRGENLIKTNDRAGKFVDKYTGVTGYRLRNAKDTIPVYDFDWILHNIDSPTWLPDRLIKLLRGNAGTMFLFKYGSKQYKPIKVNQNGKVLTKYIPALDAKGKEICIKVYKPFDPRDKLGELDFEVVDWDNMNFMVQEQRASILRRQRKGEMWKTIGVPLAIIAGAIIVSILMMKFSYDWAEGMRGAGGSVQPAADQPATPPTVPFISDLIPGT